MDARGLQKPFALGMRWGPNGEPEVASAGDHDGGETVDVGRGSIVRALPAVSALMQEAARHDTNAHRLYEGLEAVVRYVRSEQAADGVEGLPSDVDDAAALLVELQEYAPPPEADPCPECTSGKHENCDGTAMVDDQFVACPCFAAGHPKEPEQ